MKTLRSICCIFLCLLLIAGCATSAHADEGPRPFPLTVHIGGGTAQVRAFAESYPGNLYLSLLDLGIALRGSEKQFRLSYTKASNSFSLDRGQAPDGGSDRATGWEGVSYLSIQRNKLMIDGRESRYYTYRADRDLYMNLTDVQLVLDMSIEPEEDGSLRLNPSSPFAPDIQAMKAEGYFEVFNAVLLADAESGELIFSAHHDRAVPIASISKLMTYLLLREAADAGEISLDDMVTVSQRASQLSDTADGMVSLRPGQQVPLEELVQAMLLASSNEAALALAEHIAGSEAAFVERMNQRARELELRSAVFYSPHGLPSYSEGAVRVKRQNSMSALDLFRLCQYLLAHYPDVTDVTAQQFGNMPALDYSCANSNPLVFNMDGVTGLKTGSTNKAGSCLVATLPVQRHGEKHSLVLILLGAETAELRGQAAQILLRWGAQLPT